MADVLSVIADIIKQDKIQKREHAKVMREVQKKLKEKEVDTTEDNADFMGAASQAAADGKKEFEFPPGSGKMYTVTLKDKDVGKKIAKKMDDEDEQEEELSLGDRVKARMRQEDEEEPSDDTEEPEVEDDDEEEEEPDTEPEEEEEVQAKPTATKVDKLKAEDLNLDLSSQTQELFEGQELDEEFKQRASVIFETVVSKAILEQVNERLETLEEVAAVEIAEGIQEAEVKMAEKIDDYLTYVAEEFCKENELAIERGIRAELAESFITGLKSLFEKHYVDVPEEKVDIVEQLFGKVESLEEKLNVEMQTNIEALKEMKNFKK